MNQTQNELNLYWNAIPREYVVAFITLPYFMYAEFYNYSDKRTSFSSILYIEFETHNNKLGWIDYIIPVILLTP